MPADGTVKKRGRPRIHAPKLSTPYQSIGRGVPLRAQSRVLVCSLRDYFVQERDNKGTLLPLEQVTNRTSAALNINKNTVVKICQERERMIAAGEAPKFNTPNKKRNIAKRVTRLDAFQTDAIRRHVHQYFIRKEHPTLKKLGISLQEAGLFVGSKSSLATVLKQVGFTYKKFDGRKVLLERTDLVAWRCKFLREIRKEQFEDIVWLDETWVNTGHTRKQGWTDDTKQGTMAVPIGRGERIILVHAGTSRGFVANCLLLFSSKKTNDYHEEMNHETFYKWFNEQLLNNLEKPSIIVMDNASYHSKILDKAPTMSSTNNDMKIWLKDHNIHFEDDFKKAELYHLISQYKPDPPLYIIDEMAKSRGHRIIRIPPYHCHFNTIELIWAQIKGYVAERNKKFTITEIKKLTHEAMENVTGSDWEKAVKHTKTVIERAWENEGIMEEAVERVIINLGAEDSDDEDEDEEVTSLLEQRRDIDDPLEELRNYEDECLVVEDEECWEESVEDNDFDLCGVKSLSQCDKERVIPFSQF